MSNAAVSATVASIRSAPADVPALLAISIRLSLM
jgi:hypothetical protein